MAILPIDGYLVIIHDSNIFPDTTSGESHELFLTYGEESFIALRALLVFTDPNLRSISAQTRKCYFDEDTSDTAVPFTNYSFSNCITSCRTFNTMALCGCVPFYVEADLWPQSDGVIYCTLQHVSCLLSYK
ncbi:PREDICTED: pickpocket protein 11-like, partial [Rhagoletis zephyria]|uniref:pickpocket protein 11-like n=1 Tax=Rhagoletis zephyria TaxID=28612 RepID=UPI0008119B6C